MRFLDIAHSYRPPSTGIRIDEFNESDVTAGLKRESGLLINRRGGRDQPAEWV